MFDASIVEENASGVTDGSTDEAGALDVSKTVELALSSGVTEVPEENAIVLEVFKKGP